MIPKKPFITHSISLTQKHGQKLVALLAWIVVGSNLSALVAYGIGRITRIGRGCCHVHVPALPDTHPTDFEVVGWSSLH